MRRAAVILGFIAALQPAAFASDAATPEVKTAASELNPFAVRPFESSSTDVFSIFQILLQARSAYERQDYRNAAKHYSIAAQYDDGLEEAVIGLIKSNLAMGRAEDANTVLKGSRLSSPEMAVLRVLVPAMRAQPAEAKRALSAAVETYDDSRLWNRLGSLWAAEGEFSRAAQAYVRAEKAGQGPGLLHNNLGLLALQRHDLKLAAHHLGEAVERAPAVTKFDNNRRLVLLLSGEYLEALDGMDEARRLRLAADAARIARRRGDEAYASLLRGAAAHYNPQHNPNIE